MTRTHGRARYGARLVAKVPHGHWQALTFLAALRHDRITAPCAFDGPINGTNFLAYVEQVLAPALSPGDIVIMDNLGSHKGHAVRAAIRAAGPALLLAALLARPQSDSRRCYARPPNVPSRRQKRIGALLECFASSECANFRH